MAESVDFPLNDIEKLPAFPTQSSQILGGQYVIKSPQGIEYESPDNQFNAETWFKSPPLASDVIQRITKIQLFAESHDQGFADQPSGGNWTWFEIVIFEDESTNTPRVKDGIDLIWRSHRNRFLTSEFGWKEGMEFDEKHDMLRLLEPGNVLAVRVCARFPGWLIAAKEGLLVIDVGAEKVDREPVEYSTITTHIQTVHEALNAVNLVGNAAFLPTVPENLFRADMLGSTEDRPLRVLSLDGGGVRGMASLKILQAIMAKGAPNKKPCEVFDMIGGTSTGGLIAIMLGRLRMSVDETISKYEQFMTKVFGKSSGMLKVLNKIKNFGTEGEQYDATILEQVIRQIVKEKLGSEDAKLLEDQQPNGPKPCKVFCMATRADASNNRGPVFLRSYRNPQDISLLPDIKIWEAARATSAAPYYFKPMQIGPYKLVDGGLGANNPLGWLWTEVLGVFGPARQTDCFLSIGTGIPPNKALSDPAIVDPLHKGELGFAGAATNTQIIHILFRTLLNAFAPKPMGKKYFRLNIGEETGNLGKDLEDLHSYKETGSLDDVGALKELLKMTDTYLQVQQDEVNQCAKTLADAVS